MLATMIAFQLRATCFFQGCNVIVLASGTLILTLVKAGLLSHNNLQKTSSIAGDAFPALIFKILFLSEQ
jgi:hypothetical protein